jgi:hypothetical protein
MPKRIIRHANLFHPSSLIPHPLLASYAHAALRYRHHGRVRVAEKVDEQKW